ncbi:Na+/H+ antiporter subunit E [Aliiroseovarius sp. N1Y82]|nr:Na+/H+ antiporter subunit E [Aliiroseovarius subalbicans]
MFATLLLFWILLNGSLAFGTLTAGAVAAGAITFLFKDSLSVFSGYRIMPASLVASVRFVAFFFRELVRANLQLARLVLTPSLPIRPAIVRVHTGLKSPVGRLLLANAITLTPGTLSVEIKGEWLYVHWVSAEAGAEVATARIAAGFERYLEVMYG